MPDTGLVVERLSVSYGKNEVLRSVDLEVAAGEIVGLVGRNGAGKTTLLSSISGTVKASGGTRQWAGKRLSDRPDRVARAGVAHVPEGRGMLRSLTVRDNLKVAAAAVGRKFDDELLTGVFTVFPKLQEILGRLTGVLSGGEQQMVALARGMVARPALMLVDEMSLGLAPVVIQQCWNALLDLQRSQNLTLLIVDQNIDLVRRHCDRVLVLEHGSLREVPREEPGRNDRSNFVYFS